MGQVKRIIKSVALGPNIHLRTIEQQDMLQPISKTLLLSTISQKKKCKNFENILSSNEIPTTNFTKEKELNSNSDSSIKNTHKSQIQRQPQPRRIKASYRQIHKNQAKRIQEIVCTIGGQNIYPGNYLKKSSESKSVQIVVNIIH